MYIRIAQGPAEEWIFFCIQDNYYLFIGSSKGQVEVLLKDSNSSSKNDITELAALFQNADFQAFSKVFHHILNSSWVISMISH